MEYKLIIPGQVKGANELLNGRYYDKRSRRYYNKVKRENDALCVKAIRSSRSLWKVKIRNPIIIDYQIFARDKRHDRMNLFFGIDKSFEDALQKTRIIKNDGWDDVLNTTHSFYIDRENPRIEITIMEVDT